MSIKDIADDAVQSIFDKHGVYHGFLFDEFVTALRFVRRKALMEAAGVAERFHSMDVAAALAVRAFTDGEEKKETSYSPGAGPTFNVGPRGLGGPTEYGDKPED